MDINNNTKLTLHDVQERLLRLAVAFDEICQRHGIKYYMLGGTMLGAIRHKGFIPWDDDMDFGVMREDFDKLAAILEKELPKHYQCCTFQNSRAVIYPVMKLADMETCLLDQRIDLPPEQQLGVNIDIFPLDRCPQQCYKISFIRFLVWLTTIVYVESTPWSKSKHIIKKILRSLCPISNSHLCKIAEHLSRSIGVGNCIANHYGRWKSKEIIPEGWYGEGTKYEFNGKMLMGFKEYDLYLTRLYGNYMSLPPENQRISHVENIYKRFE